MAKATTQEVVAFLRESAKKRALTALCSARDEIVDAINRVEKDQGCASDIRAAVTDCADAMFALGEVRSLDEVRGLDELTEKP